VKVSIRIGGLACVIVASAGAGLVPCAMAKDLSLGRPIFIDLREIPRE